MKEDNTYRINMVENHIRTLNVIDDNVLNTLKTVPRKNFVPEKYKSFAHVDIRIPLGHKQFMLLPSVEAKLLQAINIQKDEDVLVVGSGSGYLSTCVSMFAGRVHSIDIIKDFIDVSKKIADKMTYKNMIFEHGNVLDNPSLIKNYKVIIFTMALNELEIILDNMSNNARSFILHSELNQPVQTGIIIHKTDKSSFVKEYILETNVESIITEKIQWKKPHKK
tara:strand:+ start:408 stop:1073 length:666 start_codon:yes stop_codon:yes gene_type:complete